jgi:hypothetical protein
MKSYLKLFGPSIDKGIDALFDLMKNLGKRFQYGNMISYIVSTIDPSVDLTTGKMIGRGIQPLGEYDFIIEWTESPSSEQVRALIRRIDGALLYTGCRYTVTTKE